jgi:hypothetical protein
MIYPEIKSSDRNPLNLPEGQEIGARKFRAVPTMIQTKKTICVCNARNMKGQSLEQDDEL